MLTMPPSALISRPESTGTGGRGDNDRAVHVTASARTSRSTLNFTEGCRLSLLLSVLKIAKTRQAGADPAGMPDAVNKGSVRTPGFVFREESQKMAGTDALQT